MKILIVSQYFFPENFRINDLAKGLHDKGHSITVLTGMPNYPKGEIFPGYAWPANRKDSWEGIEILRVPLYRRRQSLGRHLALNYLSFLVSASLLGPAFLRKRPFDVVFVTNYSPATIGIPGALLARLKRAPMIFWVQDLWPESLSATNTVRSPAVLRAIGRMMRWIYRRSALIGTQSRAFFPAVEAWGGEPQKLRYFPNWAEPVFNQPVGPAPGGASEASFQTDEFKVVFAGNLGKAQSLETIVEAADHLADQPIRWILLGDGRYAPAMKTQIAERNLQDRFHFLGNQPLEDMPWYFSRSDAMLVTLGPDPIFAATIPGKIQSYMACGRPILGALNGEGARVINESGAGIAVASQDHEGLADAVVALSRKPPVERREMGNRALAYYRSTFDREMILTRIESDMNALLEQKR